MNTLSIKQLRFSGIHGVEKKEKNNPQPFEVDVSITYDFSRSIKTGLLADTIDYKDIESIVKSVIEGESHTLIESLTNSIAERILKETKVSTVEVVLKKLQARSIGVPSLTLHKMRTLEGSEKITDVLGLTKERVTALYNKDTDGILHIKGALYNILNSEKLQEWYQKKWQNFEKKDEKYIENNQEVAVVYNGPFEHIEGGQSPQKIALHQLFRTIRKELARHSTIPMKTGDRLETKLIKYPVSTLGVGAHKDLSSNINAIVLFNLYGTTTFYTASDKNRSDEKAYLVEPGDIVIMRGPRNAEENNIRPIHYVLDIVEERLVFVCREIEDEVEKIINKGNWMGF